MPEESVSEDIPSRESFENWRQSVIGANEKKIVDFVIHTLPEVTTAETKRQSVSWGKPDLAELFSTSYKPRFEDEQRIPDWVLDELDKKLGTTLREIARERFREGILDSARLGAAFFLILEGWRKSPAFTELVDRKLVARKSEEELRKMSREEIKKEVWTERLAALELIPEARDQFLDYLRFSTEETTYDRFRELDDYLQKFKGKEIKILDAGCSWGEMTERFAKLLPTAKVYGLDMYELPIPSLKQKAKYIKGDILNPPFGPDSFNVIILSRVLDHFTPEGIEKAIKTIKELLVNQGEMLIGPFFQGQDKRWEKGIFLVCRKDGENLVAADTIITKETLAHFT